MLKHRPTESLFLFVFLLFSGLLSAQNSDGSKMQTLLSRLSVESIESFQKDQKNNVVLEKTLLEYYKKRTNVKHPFHTKVDEDKISEKELKYANDALNHVFVGQPAYDSYFCGEDIDWNSRPVKDMEWVWQLNRMYFWRAMGKVYTKSGEEKYAKEWCEQLVDWTNKNPNDKEHEHAWRSIETGIRGHSWMELFYRFRKSDHFDADVLVAFMNSCYQHAEFLMTKYRSGSNWALMEAEGLAYIAFTFPEFKNAEKWKKEAIRRLNNEIDLQVYKDGQQRELSMGYHIGCIGWFYRTFELAKINKEVNAFPKSFLERIEKMCEVPMKLCFPDGTNAQFGDSWAGKPHQYYARFLDWAKLFDRDDFLYMGTGGKEGVVPNQTAYALEESGLYSMRSSWDEDAIAMVLKCGPDGGGHCQQDNGTFSLYAGGRTLMPDGGSFIYSGDPEGRKWFRQTSVHQTLTLNGENTAYNPKLLQWETSENLDVLVVENAGYDNLTHRRAVLFVDKRYFVVVDEAIGSGIGDVDVHFQLGPGETTNKPDEFSVSTDFKEGVNLLVKSNKQNGLEFAKEEGWVSFVYTKKQPRPAFRYRLNKKTESQNIRFLTVVAPYEDEIPDIDVEAIGNVKVGSNHLQIRVTENGVEKTIGYNF